jgi:hypothetical protein
MRSFLQVRLNGRRGRMLWHSRLHKEVVRCIIGDVTRNAQLFSIQVKVETGSLVR